MAKYQTFEPCLCCGAETENGNALHHIYTRKSRPDLAEKVWNKAPVCKLCHNFWHDQGTSKVTEEYPPVEDWLTDKGWEYEEFYKKWRHPDASEGSRSPKVA